MSAGHLPLATGTRLLHIGPHKTGTSSVQGAFHLARSRLAAEGIFYPGQGRQPLWPILAVTGQQALRGEPQPSPAYWDYLVRDIRQAGSQRTVLSSEFFAQASDEVARRVVTDLGDQVHVVVTLRSLTRILPSQWQQYLQNGYQFPYLEWLEGILAEPPDTPTPGFWRRHRHDTLVTRWAEAVGPANLTVIVVEESDRLMLLRTFEAMVGLPSGFLEPEDRAANRSLTLAEVELVRRLNQGFTDRDWPERNYARFMRYGAIEQMKTARQPAADEPRITTPGWALKRAAEISAGMAENIGALGVHVIGDLATLGQLPAGTAEDDPAQDPIPPIPVEAAVQAVLGAFAAGGAGGQSTEEIVREVGTKSLAKVLLQRGRDGARQRVRKALPSNR